MDIIHSRCSDGLGEMEELPQVEVFLAPEPIKRVVGDTKTYEVKDSGQRQEFSSGMVRDTNQGKTVWALIFDGPMLRRYAEHLTKGAVKYTKRNWMKANSAEEMERFRESAANHFAKWMAGEQDEDHAAAVIFNLNGYEYVKEKL